MDWTTLACVVVVTAGAVFCVDLATSVARDIATIIADAARGAVTEASDAATTVAETIAAAIRFRAEAGAAAADALAEKLTDGDIDDPDADLVNRWAESASSASEGDRWAVEWALRRLRGADTDQGSVEDANDILSQHGVRPFMG